MFLINISFMLIITLDMLETDKVLIGWIAIALVSISIVKNLSIAIYFVCK